MTESTVTMRQGVGLPERAVPGMSYVLRANS